MSNLYLCTLSVFCCWFSKTIWSINLIQIYLVQGHLDCLTVICMYMDSPVWHKHQSHHLHGSLYHLPVGQLFSVISESHLPPGGPSVCSPHGTPRHAVVPSVESCSLHKDLSKGAAAPSYIPQQLGALRVFWRVGGDPENLKGKCESVHTES